MEIESGTGEIEAQAGSVAGVESEQGLRGDALVVGLSRPALRPRLRLTERDYDLFRFLLDQKFGSLEMLYFRFFDGRKDPKEPLPKNLFVARQRLGLLRRAGFLMTERVYSEAKNLYLLSPLGFHAFRARFDEDAYAAPIKQVDFRSFDHDQAVSLCRVAIERQGKAWKWFSDRRLRMHGFQAKGSRYQLPESIVPDGIFISSKGERVAFELEATHRKKSRYEWKCNEYERVMREGYETQPLFHRVLFVAGTPRVYESLKDVLQGRQGFMLESYQHFLGRLYPPSVPIPRPAAVNEEGSHE